MKYLKTVPGEVLLLQEQDEFPELALVLFHQRVAADLKDTRMNTRCTSTTRKEVLHHGT